MRKKKELDLITIGYHKGEMDFGVSAVVGTLSLKELKELREMIVVAIWVAEDMWRRNQPEEAEMVDDRKKGVNEKNK